MKNHLSAFALTVAFLVGTASQAAWLRDFTLFPSAPKILSHWQIKFDILKVMDPGQSQPPVIIAMDPHYALPSYETAIRLIAAAAKKVDHRYVPHAWDCEDVSMQFIVEIRRLARIESREFPSGFPAALVGTHVFGPIQELGWGFEEYPFGHAMVAIRIADGRWLLVEPQNGKAVDITSPIYEGLLDVIVVIL